MRRKQLFLSGLRWAGRALAVALVTLASCVNTSKSVKPEETRTTGRTPARVTASWGGDRVTIGAPQSLFNGKTLDPWQPVEFGGSGEPRVEDGCLILPTGERVTGVTWHGGELPRMSYEISLEAKRVDGTDFFCGLTFPVGDSYASLILGGWGGSLCGISSLNDDDAAHNETKSYQEFHNGQWYRVRMRVTPTKLESWVDDKKIIDVVTTGKKIALRSDVDESKPLGLTSFASTAALRNIRLVALEPSTTRPTR
jgi:hypothetical protein